MKRESLVPLALLAALAGCAERPSYFGSAARVKREKGAEYREAPALSPSYLQVRMRRPRRAVEGARTVYEGTLSLHPMSPAVFNSRNAAVRSAPASISEEGAVGLKKRLRHRRTKRRAASRKDADEGALAAARALRKDADCAALDETLSAARVRSARTGESETAERSTQGRFMREGCAAWLVERGGVGAARRRLRLAQWTSLGGE